MTKSNISCFDNGNNKRDNNYFENSCKDRHIMIRHDDVNELVTKFAELGAELAELRVALSAHQNKVRKILLDSKEIKV